MPQQSLLTGWEKKISANAEFIQITTQLKDQEAVIDMKKGKLIKDGNDKKGAIIEYPIIPSKQNAAEFASIIVFIDSAGNIFPAYKGPVAAYKEAPPLNETKKITICGFWSSWSTISYDACRLHPNCPPNVYGTKLAYQKRTRKCTGGQTQTQSRWVFVGCNCYT